jgi:hypothetical protein
MENPKPRLFGCQERTASALSSALGLASETFLLRSPELLHVTHMDPHQLICSIPICMNSLSALLKFSLQLYEFSSELHKFLPKPCHFAPESR